MLLSHNIVYKHYCIFFFFTYLKNKTITICLDFFKSKHIKTNLKSILKILYFRMNQKSLMIASGE